MIRKNALDATSIADHIAKETGCTMYPYRQELALILSEWKILHPDADGSSLVDRFNKIDSNNDLISYVLGVAPSSRGLLLHNLIFAMRPESQVLTNKGCSIIFDYCDSKFAKDISLVYRPCRQEVKDAAEELSSSTDAPCEELYASLNTGTADVHELLKWAAINPSTARRKDKFLDLIAGCALASREPVAATIDLCVLIVDELGSYIYPYGSL